MSDYIATDADLPDIFWPPRAGEPVADGGGAATPDSASSALARTTALQLHYPEIRIKPRQRQRQEAALRSEREISLEEKKQYVKLAKKIQMESWLRGLQQTFPIMKPRERGFCEQLLLKFQRYTPYAVKWITRRQYDWLEQIATTYIQLPERQ